MTIQSSLRPSSLRLAPSTLALALALCGCAADDEPQDPNAAPNNSESQQAAGVSGSAGAPVSAGAATAGARDSTFGGSPQQAEDTSGDGVAGAAVDPGGAAGAAGAREGGAVGGGAAGAAGEGSVSAAGTTAGGAASSGTAGTADAAGAPAGGAANQAGASDTAGAGGSAAGSECTREQLEGLLRYYFAALSSGDASGLPLAAGVKFTENAEQVEIGTTAFWMNAGETKYFQSALDTQQCSVAAHAVIPEGTTDLPFAIRIKVTDGEMSEIETIVVRAGDYSAPFAVESDPAAIIAAAEAIGWDQDVPEALRATREELTHWIDKYFRAFPAGVCDVTADCRRLENGGGDFSCGAGASCTAMVPTDGGTFIPRVIIVDEVRGIAAGLTLFDFQTTGHLDMHMMKMSGGQVHAVHVMLRNTNGESGWE